MKPSPSNIQELYLGSLQELGLDPTVQDIRFVEDDWENPTLGAWGLGWEVWLNGMEVTQFTYFQQVGGLDCKPVLGEITYGLERLAMYLQGVENVYDLIWTHLPDGSRSLTAMCSSRMKWNSPVRVRAQQCRAAVPPVQRLRGRGQVAAGSQPAAAGLRDDSQGRSHFQPAGRARRDLGDRARTYIGRIRTLSRVAQAYYDAREALGFPMCRQA